MLRARGIDPALLAVRGAGPLEPLKPGAGADELVDEPACPHREHQ
jgi:OOP family OmpA-OmpF porin